MLIIAIQKFILMIKLINNNYTKFSIIIINLSTILGLDC